HMNSITHFVKLTQCTIARLDREAYTFVRRGGSHETSACAAAAAAGAAGAAMGAAYAGDGGAAVLPRRLSRPGRPGQPRGGAVPRARVRTGRAGAAGVYPLVAAAGT